MKNSLILICFCLLCACGEDNNTKIDASKQQLCSIESWSKGGGDLEAQFNFNGAGNLEYDSSGNLISKTWEDADGDIDKQVVYTYNSDNQKIKEKGSEGIGYLTYYVTTWAYDKNGRLLTKTTEKSSDADYYYYTEENYAYNKQNQLESYEHDSIFTTILSESNAEVEYHKTVSHQYSYNSLGQLAQETVDVVIKPIKIEKFNPDEEIIMSDNLTEKKELHYSIGYGYNINGILQSKELECGIDDGSSKIGIWGWFDGKILAYQDSHENGQIAIRYINKGSYTDHNVETDKNDENHNLGFDIDINRCSNVVLASYFQYDLDGSMEYARVVNVSIKEKADIGWVGDGITGIDEIHWDYDEDQRIVGSEYQHISGDPNTSDSWISDSIDKRWEYDDEDRLIKSFYSKANSFYNEHSRLTYYTYDDNGRLDEELQYLTIFDVALSIWRLRYVYGDCTKD